MTVEKLLEKTSPEQKLFIVEWGNPRNHLGTYSDPIKRGNVFEITKNFGKFASMRVDCFFASNNILCIFTLPKEIN